MTYPCPICGEPMSPDFDHEHWAIEMESRLDREFEAREAAYFEALAEWSKEWSW